MTGTFGVGLIGVNPDGGWARESHVPAIHAVDGLELTAVATRHQASADRAAVAFEATKGCGDPMALIADPDVDIVAVATAVPAHRDLILAGLRAGKHIYCEWPLVVDLEETERIAAAATDAGVHTATGLQARFSGAVSASSRVHAVPCRTG